MERDPAFTAFEQAVSMEMKRMYGITWADASGDAEPLESALADGWSAEQFVRWFGDRYDLDRVDHRYY